MVTSNLEISSATQTFISSLNLPLVAGEILRNIEDCNNYYENFHRKGKRISDDLMNFRQHQIRNSNITLDMFLDMCYTIGIREAFENTFFERYSDEKIDFIKQQLGNRKITLEAVYEKFMDNPKRNIIRYFK